MAERLLELGRQFAAALGMSGVAGLLAGLVLGVIVARWSWAFRSRQRRVATVLALSNDRTLVGLTRSALVRSMDYHVPIDAFEEPHPDAKSRVPPKRRAASTLLAEVLESRSPHRVLLVLGEPGYGKTSLLVRAWASHRRRQSAAQAPVFLASLGASGTLDAIGRIGAAERERSTVFLDGLDLDPRARKNPGRRLREVLDLCNGFRRIVVSARADLFASADELPWQNPESEPVHGVAMGDSADSSDGSESLGAGAEREPGSLDGAESAPRAGGSGDTDPHAEASRAFGADPAPSEHAPGTRVTAEASRAAAAKRKGAPQGLRVIRLAAFSPKQVRRYLELRYPLYLLLRRRSARRILGNVEESGLAPLVLSQLPALVSYGKPLAELPSVYEAALRGWIRQEQCWINGDALFEWSKRAALRAYRSIVNGQGPVVSELDVKTVSRDDLAYPNWRLGAGSLLHRAEDGSLEFAHATLAECLYVIAFCSMLPEARRDWLCGDDVPWTPAMQSFAVRRFALPMAPLAFVDLRGVTLTGKELADSTFWKAHLEGADLSGADLRRADLRGAQLTGANLAGADLTEADLTGAELSGANLEGAVLRGAALVSASINPAAARSIAPTSAELDDGLLVEPITGMRLAWIPGGRFQMGSPRELNESPVHPVRLSSFWMGLTPVTNREYECFLKATGYERPACVHDPRFADPDQPVVGVSHADALAFCSWLSEASGLPVTLPSEAQWEYAARGTDGREYPWGPARPDPSRACFAEDAFDGRPAKVGSFPPGKGPFGNLDQAGNVWEWCLDAWDENAYVKRVRIGSREAVDPVVDMDDAAVRSVRGGSWFFPPDDLRASFRGKTLASSRDDDLGFRVVVLTTQAEVRDDSFLVGAALARANSIHRAPRAAQ